jgi:mannose-6-phosphate isomerase
MTTTLQPHVLPPNVIDLFYRGGERIAALRWKDGPGVAGGEPLRRPEEWLASTVTRWGTDGPGPTELDGLGLLADLIVADPEGWLGGAHVARWGSSPALLVKLLDAGQRLPVHFHPDRRFATTHLGCPFGKTEAWAVLDVPAGGGTVFVGTTRPVRREEWAELVDAQAADAMLELLHPIRVNEGDGVLVPASTPHSIDAGVFIVELQEPTDFSVLLEWDGFDIDGRADGHLGLGFDVALGAVRTDALATSDVDRLIRRAAGAEAGVARPVLPENADPYFRAWAVDSRATAVTVPAAFTVVVVTAGAGTVRWAGGQSAVNRGDALVVPFAAGALTFEGDVTAVVAQPPAPDAPEPVEACERVSASERAARHGLRGRGTQ